MCIVLKIIKEIIIVLYFSGKILYNIRKQKKYFFVGENRLWQIIRKS